jgi:hypothetical protein
MRLSQTDLTIPLMSTPVMFEPSGVGKPRQP